MTTRTFGDTVSGVQVPYRIGYAFHIPKIGIKVQIREINSTFEFEVIFRGTPYTRVAYTIYMM